MPRNLPAEMYPDEPDMERISGGKNDSITPSDFRGRSAHDERRCEPRFLSSKIISVLPCDLDWNMRFHRVEMVDCSLHGIGVLSPLPFAARERFLAKLRVIRFRSNPRAS
jgi:hypothetical protein